MHNKKDEWVRETVASLGAEFACLAEGGDRWVITYLGGAETAVPDIAVSLADGLVRFELAGDVAVMPDREPSAPPITLDDFFVVRGTTMPVSLLQFDELVEPLEAAQTVREHLLAPALTALGGISWADHYQLSRQASRRGAFELLTSMGWEESDEPYTATLDTEGYQAHVRPDNVVVVSDRGTSGAPKAFNPRIPCGADRLHRYTLQIVSQRA